MGNPNQCIKSEVQFLLHHIFLYEQRYDKNKAAIYCNRAPDTFHRWCNCTKPIPVDMVRKIIGFIAQENSKDTELAELFCPPGNIIMRAVKSKISREERRKKEVGLSILSGKILEAIEKAYEDGKIEKMEYKPIHRLLTRIRQLAAEFDEKIKQEVK